MLPEQHMFEQGAEDIPLAQPEPQATPTLSHVRERWHRIRNKLLASPRFQSAVARTPLLRRIGQQKATELHHITAGFVYSQILFALVESGLIDKLSQGPTEVESLTRLTGLDPEGLLQLLKGGESLNLLTMYPGNRVGLGELGAAMVGNPGIAAMVKHHQLLYRDLADPLTLLKQRQPTTLSQYWPYALDEPMAPKGSEYSELMAASQQLIAGHVLDAYNIGQHSNLIDIAGGTGNFAKQAIGRHPDLTATVLDLPSVVDSASNDDPRLSFRPTNMFTGLLPESCELLSLIRVLHDHDDQPVRQLLARAFNALRPGGRLLIAEPMAGTAGSEAIGDGYFGMYLWAMGSGRPRTAPELKSMLRAAGFTRVWEARSNMPCLVRVLVAERPSG